MGLSQEDEVLVQSYATLSLLHELENKKFLESKYFKNLEFQDKFVKKALPVIGIGNRGMVLISLYALLVVPKELLQDIYPAEFIRLNEVIDKLKINNSTSSTYKKDTNGIDFIQHIRNAVAHARVEFVSKETVTFYDSNKNENCTIVLPLSRLPEFVKVLEEIFLRYIERLRSK